MSFKTVFFLILYGTSLFGAGGVYDTNILNLQTKVFPKLILADKNFEKKLKNQKLTLTILYEKIDQNTAEKLKNKINQNYPSLKNYPLEVELITYNNFNEIELSNAYFFLLGDKQNIQKIAKKVTQKNRMSFCYDNDDIENGVILGLEIGREVSLLLNLNALKQSEIIFENSILKVAKIK